MGENFSVPPKASPTHTLICHDSPHVLNFLVPRDTSGCGHAEGLRAEDTASEDEDVEIFWILRRRQGEY